MSSLKGAIADLERQRVSLLLPLILEARLAAVLCVGEKLSGEIYERQEIELLETLLREAGVALQNARLYADPKRQMDELRRTQDQLMQSAKLAAIGELAAGIAHEVNNPLMVITGHAGLLRRRPELAAIHPTIDTIEGQATRAAGMIRGLLDFARRRSLHREHVRLRDVVERAFALVADKLDTHAIEAVTLLDEADPKVFGDRDQLTQVFINLVGNAADAMPDGGRLTVSTEVRRQDDVAYVSARVPTRAPASLSSSASRSSSRSSPPNRRARAPAWAWPYPGDRQEPRGHGGQRPGQGDRDDREPATERLKDLFAARRHRGYTARRLVRSSVHLRAVRSCSDRVSPACFRICGACYSMAED